MFCVLKYKILFTENFIMANSIPTDRLKPTSTDMLVNFLGNTEKMVSADKRWNYGDDVDEEDELDEDVENYMSDKKEVFEKTHNDGDEELTHHSKRTNDVRKTEQSYAENDMGVKSEEEKPMSKEELAYIKLDTLRKLGELKRCGVHLSQNYGMDDDLKMMQYELKLHTDIRSKENAVQWMSHMMIGCVKGFEMLNDNYNPFDIKLEGLTDKISADMHNYYMVLGEIYEKYNQPGKQMAPEMKLLLMLSGAMLSIQASRIIPQVMQNALPRNNNKDEKVLEEFRNKAQTQPEPQPNTQSNPQPKPQSGPIPASSIAKINEMVGEEHTKASQKLADMHMLKQKELEYIRIKKMMDRKNDGSKSFRDAMILSTESPRQGERVKRVNNRPNEEEINRMKYADEQHQLELMRKMAYEKSIQQRANAEQTDKSNDLEKKSKKLDQLLNRFGNGKESDNQSDRSTRSTISKNPDFANIMRSTEAKNMKPVSPLEKTLEKTPEKTPEKTNTKTNAKTKTNTKANTKTPVKKITKSKANQKVIEDEEDELDGLDEDIDNLLDENDELSGLTNEDISFGSNGKKNQPAQMISFGSKKKGTQPALSFN
jgi:hypothetical protein